MTKALLEAAALAGAVAVTVTATVAVAVAVTVAAAPAPPPFDAARVRTGRFSYDVRDGQTVVASGVLQVRRAGAAYDFDGTFTAAVCQHWESAAAATFAPRTARLQFCKDGPDRPIFELVYAPGRVTGVSFRGVPPALERTAVDAAVPDGIVDQRIDWAAVMALDLRPGHTFRFDVYDPGTGISPLTGRVAGEETADVPAGRFPVYRLDYQMTKAGRAERYQSLVTAATPRMLVAITFPNGTTSRLVAYTPTTAKEHAP